MLEIISVIFPIFITIFIGYLSLYFSILNKEAMKVIGLFIIKVSLPCLLLVSISSQDFHSLIQIPYLMSYGLASSIVFIVTVLIYLKKFEMPMSYAAVMGMGAAMSNTGFIGSGLLYLFLGEKAAIYFGMTFLVENFIVFLMFLICLELGQQQTSVKQILKSGLMNIVKNPLIIALILGFIFSASQRQLPEILQLTLRSIGQTSAPLGLCVIGGSLYGISLHTQQKIARDIVIIASLKLIIMPLLVYVIFLIVPNTSKEMIFAGVLLSSVSMVGLYAVFGQQYDMQKVPPILLVTTLLSIVSMSLVIHYLRV
ncbi:AEC family transporter [Acinetobacter sichuanensis]|uniref:AEC family transporter n=1 Tax=Acinetobacter sichuanensis TaxID=2136183 RepID=UPI00280F0BFE|nr:AEC family transporter [Acinetobacter sichuanensis]MDQ9021260.1 AEC family transporter [Acinetobacter sichuanensis]